MSIAVSAIVVPSRALRALVLFFGLCNLGAAAAVAFWLHDRFPAAPLCASFFLLAAACLLHSGVRGPKTHQIDISGLGQLHLTVQQELRTNDAGGGPAVAVSLLAGSTVWPQLMLLLLRSEDGKRFVLPILRDSVPPPQFRALAVALRAAGGRNPGTPYHPFVGTHKIL
jgi:toxin CptA